MNIIKNHATNFKRYGQKRTGPFDSIEIHSIGTPQNTAENVRDSMNQYNPGGIVHAIVSADVEDKAIEILPFDNVAWADAGYGNQHSFAIEICESDYMKYQANSANYTITNNAKFMEDINRGYKNAVKYTAIKCKEFGFNPMEMLSNGLYRVYSHQEANAKGLASAHVDPTHIWSKIGKTMDIFRKEVVAEMENTQEEIPVETPEKKVTDNIWMGWIKRESGSAGFKQVNGDSGNAYGKYQFDRRYALVPFMQFCVDYNKERYQGFERYISYGAGSSSLLNNQTLASLWQAYCEKYPEEFEMLQDVYAYKYYYLEAVKYIKNLHGIIMDNHSPAVKGTLYSMSIRSGALVAARKFEGCTDSISELVMLNTSYTTYGTQDASRWTKAGQWGDAVEALENNEYTEVPTEMTEVTETIPETKEKIYRVRLKWGTDMTTQIGAYTNLQNAIDCADAAIPGYKVFDENGNIVYDTGALTVENQIRIAVKWAQDTANDNSHGYNNAKDGRGGNPDYACSSFVNEAWKQAGVDLPESATVYTAKMKSIFTKAGFEVITDEVNLKNGKGLEAGDVVLKPGSHVEIYVGNGLLAGARGNANSGKPENGKAGDQSGNEIVVSGYYNLPWTIVLRYVGIDMGETPTDTPKEYIVQAGSYSFKSNANNRAALIKSKGFDAIVKYIDGQYKVQCGVFTNKANAEKLVAALKSKGFDAIIK